MINVNYQDNTVTMEMTIGQENCPLYREIMVRYPLIETRVDGDKKLYIFNKI